MLVPVRSWVIGDAWLGREKRLRELLVDRDLAERRLEGATRAERDAQARRGRRR